MPVTSLTGLWIRAKQLIGSLTLNPVSNNVGGCQALFGAHQSVHSEERAISLSLKLLLLRYQPRLARNQGSGQETRSDPSISSVTLSIMITISNSPAKGSGIPNQLLGAGLHTIGISGLSRVRTELFQQRVIPSLTPHPVQTNRQSPRHRDLGDFSPAPHRQVKVPTAPFLVAAHRDLGRFDQQKTQQRVALFRDVS